MSPLAFAVRHINASARDPVEEHELLAAITADDVRPTHSVHAFFDESEPELFGDIVRAGLTSYATLARGARRVLPPDHPNRLWLDERA